MRKILIFSILFVSIAACRKESTRINKKNDKLIGYWLKNEVKFYAGNSERYTKQLDSVDYSLDFTDHGHVVFKYSNGHELNGTYRLTDSKIQINVQNDAGKDSFQVLYNNYRITNYQLEVTEYRESGSFDMKFSRI